MPDLAVITEELRQISEGLAAEILKFQATNTKASAQRIRTMSVAQAKVAKEFRAVSVKAL